MPNSRTATEILAVVKQAVQFQKFTAFVLPSFAAFLTGKSIPYLCNGISSSISLVSGGTLYTNSVFTIPLTGNYPAGSVPAVVTFTLGGGGVLSAPVATVPGSGYGTASFLWSPPDPTGNGCQVIISPANPDQVYNWTPAFVGFLQFYIGLDYAQIGNLMNGSVGANTASAVNVHSGAAGTSYVVAADAPVGLLAPCKMLISLSRQRVRGDPRGPGGPPHQLGSVRERGRAKRSAISRPVGPLWLVPAAPDLPASSGKPLLRSGTRP